MAISYSIVIGLIILFIVGIIIAGVASTKEGKTLEVFNPIMTALLGIGVILGIVFYNQGKTTMGLTIIGLSILIYLIAIIFGNLSKAFRAQEDETKPGVTLTSNCPDLKYVPQKTLEEIIKNLNEFYVKEVCYSGTGSCDYLFQYILKNYKELSAEELNQKINELLDEMSADGNIRLINQAKYLLYQLVQCRMKLEPTEKETIFGTLDWWKKNMWDAGNFARYTWWVSFFVSIVFFLYYVFTLLYSGDLFDALNIKTFSGKVTFAVILVIVFAIVFGYTVYYNLTAADQPYWEPPSTSSKYDPYVAEKEAYLQYEEEEGKKLSPTSATEAYGKMIWGSLFLPMLLIFFLILGMNYFDVDTFLFSWLKLEYLQAIFVILVLATTMSFNAFYMFLIPQLMIIAIILQKYILYTPTDEDWLVSTIIKVIILVVVLFASFYDTTYYATTPEKEGEVTSYNKPIWFIFGLLIAYYILNFVDVAFFDHSFGGEENKDQWSILLIPFVNYLFKIIGVDIDYNEMAVANSVF